MHKPGLLIFSLFCAFPAYAQQPAPWIDVQTQRISADEPATSQVARQELQNRLRNSVFALYVQQKPMHSLMQGVSFDGAAVAIFPDAVADIVQDKTIEQIPEEPESPNPSSVFGRGLEYHSSPFAVRPEPAKRAVSEKQYYLTTADWLNNAESLHLDIRGKRVAAKLEYRDDAQNVAVLSTPATTGVQSVKIRNAKDALPAFAFVLLSPNTRYESLTQHSVSVPTEHLYGTATLTTRNGYPLFTAQGELFGLSVGPTGGLPQTRIVHPALIDRALHPAAYSRTKDETIELKHYE